MPATNKLDFSNAQAAAKALKKVSTIMIRAGQPVVSSEFSDKARRVAGVTYREASLTVASGQIVVLRVNATGDIFQVLLNGSVQPMKNQTDSDKAVMEIAALLEGGQVAFQKAQARKAIALPKGMSTPAPKQAAVYAERVAQLDTQIAERQATVADLQQQLGAMTDSLEPAPAAPAQNQNPEPMSWLGFKLVNQAFVDEVGPMEVPSRFQIGADVFLGLGQEGDRMDIAAKVIGANFRASKVHYTLAVPTQSVGEQQMYAVLYDVDSLSVASAGDILLDSIPDFSPVQSLEAHKEPLPDDEGLAATLLDAINQQPKGFPRKWGGKLYNFDQFKLVPADEHGELPGAWTLIDGAVPVADSLLDGIEQPQDEELTVSGAYVAAREIVLADPAMMDSMATAGAIEQLRQALSVVETNAPINEAEGNLDQAKLERSLAKSFITAIAMLDSVAPDFGDSGLSELVNIAIVSAADVSDIKDEEALAQLLALGMVETAEGLYMLTDKGRSALEDAGFDAYGEPFAAED